MPRKLAAALIGLLAFFCQSSGGADSVQIQASFGFGSTGIAKAGFWAPLVLDVTFHPNDRSQVLDGQIVVTPGDGGLIRPTRFVTPLRMGSGRKRFRLRLLPLYEHDSEDGFCFTVVIENGSDIVAQRRFEYSSQAALQPEQSTLVLAVGSSSANVLGNVAASSPASAGQSAPAPISIAIVEPEQLPAAVVDYDAVTAVVWKTPRLDALDSGQRGALQSFIAEGGRLILVTDETSPLRPRDWPLPITGFPDQADTRYPREDRQEIDWHAYGQGALIRLADQPASPMDELQNRHRLLLGLPSSHTADKPAGGSLLQPRSLTETLTLHVSQFTESRPLPLWFVLLFLACFFICAGPGAYLILRRRQRLTATYAMFGVVCLSFALLATITAYVIKGDQSLTHEVQIVDLLPREHCRRLSLLALFSAVPRAVSLNTPTGVVAGLDRIEYNGMLRAQFRGAPSSTLTSASGTILCGESSAVPESTNLQQWAVERFHILSRDTTEWSLSLSEAAGPDRPTALTVANDGDAPFQQIYALVDERIFRSSAPVPAGSSVVLTEWVPLQNHLGVSSHKNWAHVPPGAELSPEAPVIASAFALPLLTQMPLPYRTSLCERLSRGDSLRSALHETFSPAQNAVVGGPETASQALHASALLSQFSEGDARDRQLDLTRVLLEGGIILIGVGEDNRERTAIVGMQPALHSVLTVVRVAVSASDLRRVTP